MRKFYLLRHVDVHQNSGTGTVAEGVVFDNGLVAMTWLSDTPTMTMFRKIQEVTKLHGHDDKTELIMEGKKKDEKKFEQCQDAVRQRKSIVKAKEDLK